MPLERSIFPRLRVFVSSLMIELAEERRVVRKALETLLDTYLFEVDAPASSRSPQETFLETVERADLYVGVFWKGYGRYTVEEFEHARRLGKECLVYEKRAGAGRDSQLQAVLDEAGQVESGVTIRRFDDAEELGRLVQEDVAAWLARKIQEQPQEEAIISLVKLPTTGSDLFGRDAELKLLDEIWADAKTNVVTFVAWGGVGKSALVNKWLRTMQNGAFRGAARVYGYSFYSQGTKEGKQASADLFIDAALRWFGDPTPETGSPWDKGERLATLVKQQRTLLVLDGLEPLQYPPGSVQEGQLKDPSLRALVRELASRNPGLCLITTRLPVRDLEGFVGTSVVQHDLSHLSGEAGAALLRSLGTEGTGAEVLQAVREFEGHALALNLLGSYLKTVYRGDVLQRDKIVRLTKERRQGGHAQRVMQSYERRFEGKPELEILYLLGLFDRPASGKEIAALRAAPAIEGLTEALFHSRRASGWRGWLRRQAWTLQSDEDWQYALAALRSARLLADEDPQAPETLDAHPLIREHFAEVVQAHHPGAWREGHRRLYEYLKGAAPEFPDTLQAMMPLYHAVAHGCKAGLWQESMELYGQRILRMPDHFSWRKLGAFGADLAAISAFFNQTWSKPSSALTDFLQSFALNQAGIYLRALGRLAEATQPLVAGLAADIRIGEWEQGAIGAINLSELYLTLGDVSAALRVAEQSVELADRGGDAFWRTGTRVVLADVLHQSAHLERSLVAFGEAEAMQAERQSEYTLLYSISGFNYCVLLLEEVSRVLGPSSLDEPTAGGPQIEAALRNCREVRRRAETALDIVLHGSQNLLDIGLNHLSLGRTYLLEGQVLRIAGREPEGDMLTQAEAHLNESVTFLHRAGTQDHLPRGQLARAALWRVCGERGRQGEAENYFERAERDLGEVEQIAGRSGMLIFQIEAALERCRLALTRGRRDEARRKLDEAQALVEKTEKSYEPHMPRWDAWEPPAYVGVIRKGEIVGYHRRAADIAALDEALK